MCNMLQTIVIFVGVVLLDLVLLLLLHFQRKEVDGRFSIFFFLYFASRPNLREFYLLYRQFNMFQ